MYFYGGSVSKCNYMPTVSALSLLRSLLGIPWSAAPATGGGGGVVVVGKKQYSYLSSRDKMKLVKKCREDESEVIVSNIASDDC